MKDFRDLQIWEKGHQLARAVYQATGSFPKEELYGLTSQLRRASASIPTNIAEGCGRQGDADFARFLQMAMGSASETDYLLILAKDLQFLKLKSYQELAEEITTLKKMLNSFLQKLRANRQ